MSNHTVLLSVALLLVSNIAWRPTKTFAEDKEPTADIARWGGDHVGQPFPLYMTGDECLFCHRDIGTTWSENRHGQTVRFSQGDDPALKSFAKRDPAAAADVQLLLGSSRVTRFLKRSPQYGKLDIHTTSCLATGSLSEAGTGQWDTTTFADRCAGCHATAVDTTARSFSAVSLDCFTCHGDVGQQHAEKTSHALLSAANKPPRQVVSICGQCHLRGGSSASSGLPYPNTFVPGDNLFRDFNVDFSSAAIAALPAIEQHIFQNTLQVASGQESKIDCLSCHGVHPSSSEQHKALDDAAICSTCHVSGTDNSQIIDAIRADVRQRSHSKVCDY